MINIEDDILHLQRLGLLDKLLYDRTTKRNIIWASDAHAGLGEAYRSNGEIRLELITGDRSGVIKTRARKELSQRSDRTRKNGEVFTPLWICRKMIDYADEMWHGEAEAAAHGGKITKKTAYSGSEQWRRYVDSRRLEITCGEAPYLVSRYDVATGSEIPAPERTGILDRKLHAADEHTATEDEWLKWVFRSFEATYGYELLGDSLLIARVNLFMTFEEYLLRRWNRRPSAKEYQRLIRIITWNVWQADGLTGKVPRFEQWNGEHRQRGLFDCIEGYNDETQNGEAPYCRVFDWRSRRSFEYGAHWNEGGNAKMKFDFIIGNPPYQEETDSDSTRMPPIYNLFMDAAYNIADRVELITPARFLFDAGYTPKMWNKKMLNDEHFKILYYESKSGEIFPNTDIKGGIAISYRDATQNFGAIGIFTTYPQLDTILQKVLSQSKNFLDSICYPALSYGLTPRMLEEHPDSVGRLRTSAFTKLEEIFYDDKPDDGYEYIQMIGLLGTKRVTKYVRRDYIKTPDNFEFYKVILPASNGSGSIGEVLSTPVIGQPVIGQPVIGHTQTFISIGRCQTEAEAQNLLKYIKSKFCRVMLGILKITQHNPPEKWRYVPLQDFTSLSDIDWSKSVAEIDRQLYAKYGLSDEEINFIETHVKEMA